MFPESEITHLASFLKFLIGQVTARLMESNSVRVSSDYSL
jgi:hypothetical protein